MTAVLGAGRKDAENTTMFGFTFDGLTMEDVVDRCSSALEQRHRTLIGVANAAKIVNARNDDRLRESLLDCDMLLADGQSVVWASKLLRRPLPERVAGIDLFERLLAHADVNGGLRVYLLGARSDVLERTQQAIAHRFPDLRLVGSHDGYFTDDEAPDIAEQIRRSGADMLFIGMTSPKKEIFLSRYGDLLGVPVMHGVGGSFDIMAGITKRAPGRWQQFGCEWLYRLLQEPGRMWRRYLRTNTAFVLITLQELARPTRRYAREARSAK
jgi:N-acetylglucosaminyldiphosphoundecaprenol N-acetyl-beta-D-mannosaminyltransferase